MVNQYPSYGLFVLFHFISYSTFIVLLQPYFIIFIFYYLLFDFIMLFFLKS